MPYFRVSGERMRAERCPDCGAAPTRVHPVKSLTEDRMEFECPNRQFTVTGPLPGHTWAKLLAELVDPP